MLVAGRGDKTELFKLPQTRDDLGQWSIAVLPNGYYGEYCLFTASKCIYKYGR